MKKFWRSVIGKTTLFVAFNLSLLILAASVVGIIGMFSLDIYTTDEKTFLHDYRENQAEGVLRSFAYYSFEEEGNYFPSYNNRSWAQIGLLAPSGEKILSENYSENREEDEYETFNFILTVKWRYDSYTKWDDENNEFGPVEVQRSSSIGIYRADVKVDEADYDYVYKASVHCRRDINYREYDEIFFTIVHLLYTMKYAVYIVAFVSLLLCIYIFVLLLVLAGRVPNSDDIHPGPFIKVPFDLLLVLAAAVCICLIAWLDIFMYHADIFIVLILTIFAIVVALCMSFATRLKLHIFWRELLIYKTVALLFITLRFIARKIGGFFRMIGNFFRMIPTVWRTALIVGVISFIELCVILGSWYEPENMFAFWIIEKIITVPLVIFVAFSLRKLEKAGEKIAAGDLTYKTDTTRLYSGFKRHAENLNNISLAMTAAVDDRTKSERMKTELITNVSHDIKTPLTSIINYANLISAEQSQNENINKYSEVLVRQSAKLRRLIEDLVEASKASTGNLEINLEPCDAGMFITQASGEYEEKMIAAGLQLITNQPDKEVRIMADTRRMWRVFDNLMNNVCKYSQTGTRVYLSLEKIGGSAVITLKNTSRDALNISADELMERFVRGDSSRNTEGNGLGLSIAKDLVVLQGGELSLSIDGDLFKARLQFSIIY